MKQKMLSGLITAAAILSLVSLMSNKWTVLNSVDSNGTMNNDVQAEISLYSLVVPSQNIKMKMPIKEDVKFPTKYYYAAISMLHLGYVMLLAALATSLTDKYEQHTRKLLMLSIVLIVVGNVLWGLKLNNHFYNNSDNAAMLGSGYYVSLLATVVALTALCVDCRSDKNNKVVGRLSKILSDNKLNPRVSPTVPRVRVSSSDMNSGPRSDYKPPSVSGRSLDDVASSTSLPRMSRPRSGSVGNSLTSPRVGSSSLARPSSSPLGNSLTSPRVGSSSIARPSSGSVRSGSPFPRIPSGEYRTASTLSLIHI